MKAAKAAQAAKGARTPSSWSSTTRTSKIDRQTDFRHRETASEDCDTPTADKRKQHADDHSGSRSRGREAMDAARKAVADLEKKDSSRRGLLQRGRLQLSGTRSRRDRAGQRQLEKARRTCSTLAKNSRSSRARQQFATLILIRRLSTPHDREHFLIEYVGLPMNDLDTRASRDN